MTEKKKQNDSSVEESLSSSYVPKGNIPSLPATSQIEDAIKKKEAEKLKKDIDLFCEKVRKKFKFVDAIGILPVQSSRIIEDEYEVPEVEAKKELIHLLVVVPESKFKEITKMKVELIKISKEVNEKIWVHVLTPIDFWNIGLDSKFDIFEAFSMSYPVYDSKNFLGSLRMSQIHKSLVLRKFEKYVTTYAMGGSFVRGELKKESDIDVIVIIDDTDVKRMSRFELIEKLRGIIYSYISEAMAMAGTKVDFNVQVWLMTDFWERVKDAEPVAFTFIRDGIPLYDRGAFLPWKSLLRMGRIKPSPESIDMFMSSGDKLKDNVDRRIFDILIHDIYWGVMHPTQGLLMLYGLAPQNVYDTAKSFRENFVDKEKLIEKKYADIFDKVALHYYKGFEHGKVKPGDISGSDVEKMFHDSLDYIKRLKDLRGQIEKRIKEKDIVEIYNNLFGQLESILHKRGEKDVISEFESRFIKTGKFPPKFLESLNFVLSVKKKVLERIKEEKKKTKKSSEHVGQITRDVDNARKIATQITNALIEYTQRCDFLSVDRARFVIKGKKFTGEVFFLRNCYVVHANKVQMISDGKLVDANLEKFEKELVEEKDREKKIDFSALEIIKKSYGDFELVY
jgi:predicted nucleotidyltransferase/uncharacterized protein (UPF0332 family)